MILKNHSCSAIRIFPASYRSRLNSDYRSRSWTTVRVIGIGYHSFNWTRFGQSLFVTSFSGRSANWRTGV